MKFTFRQWEIIQNILKKESYLSTGKDEQVYKKEVIDILEKIKKSNLG